MIRSEHGSQDPKEAARTATTALGYTVLYPYDNFVHMCEVHSQECDDKLCHMTNQWAHIAVTWQNSDSNSSKKQF